MRYGEEMGVATTKFKLLTVIPALIAISGCSSLTRLQSNMDQMVANMNVITYHHVPLMMENVTRMVGVAERMEKRSVSLMGDMKKGGNTAERAIQNYSQAVLDNERAMIKGLKGIQQELGELKPNARGASTPQDAGAQARTNAELHTKLRDLEARLAIMQSKLDRIDGKTP